MLKSQVNAPLMVHKFYFSSGAMNKMDLEGNFSIDNQILKSLFCLEIGIHVRNVNDASKVPVHNFGQDLSKSLGKF